MYYSELVFNFPKFNRVQTVTKDFGALFPIFSPVGRA